MGRELSQCEAALRSTPWAVVGEPRVCQNLKTDTGDALEIRVCNDRVGIILRVKTTHKNGLIFELGKRGAACRQETHRIEFSPLDRFCIDITLPASLCCI